MELIEGYCCLYGSINRKTGMIVWPNAYKDNDESRRPLMWNHEPRLENLIGKVILENRDVGVYCAGILEDEGLLSKYPELYLSARCAKPVVDGMKIVAGDITEVSLVTDCDYYDSAKDLVTVKKLQS